MAYFERFSVKDYRGDRSYRYGKIVCDDCAERGAVPFEELPPFSDGTPHRRQLKPWCWAPWRMGQPCDGCGRTDDEVAAAKLAAAA
jgi:hypothetical protein